jgi:large subunit ribosomal protein L21
LHVVFPASPQRGGNEKDTRRLWRSEDQEKGTMKYVILESGGKQYKAVEGGMIEVDLLPVEPGKSLSLKEVLLLVDGDTITVGAPVVEGASVKATVVEHFKGEKTYNFHYKPKKRIRQKTGHRQSYTRLAVEKIVEK